MNDKPQVAQFDCFSFDLESGCLMMRNFRVHLREQQAKLLTHMVSKAGRLARREELHSLLWPNGAPSDAEQAINKLISQLRAALGDSKNGSRFIQTVPLRGYRFIVPVTLYPLTQCKSIGGVFVVPESIGGEPLITQPIMQGSAVVGSRRVSDSPQRRTTDVLRRRTTDGLRRRSNDVPEGTGFDPGNGLG